MIRAALFAGLALGATPALAGEAETAALSAFEGGCLASLPDFIEGAPAFVEAGMTGLRPGVFGGETGLLGFMTQSEDGATRTCTVGVRNGDAEFLDGGLARLIEAAYPAEAVTAAPPGRFGANAAYLVQVPDTGLLALFNVREVDAGLIAVGVVVKSPGGFE